MLSLVMLIAIFTVASAAFLLTSGFHAQCLMAILKVKTLTHISLVACA